MKKYLILMALVLVVVTGLVLGCTRGEKTYINQEETIKTSVDNEFVVALDSNPTTGYSWVVSYDDTMLSLDYEDFSSEKCPGLVGAGGTQYFGFKALKAGETEITLDYLRSWEDESIDQRVFTVIIK